MPYRKLNLPDCTLTTKASELPSGKPFVFDPARKAWVALTPEERVRQYFINYLTQYLCVPLTHISVEQAFSFANGKPQRADIVIYSPDATPFMLIECKAPSVKLTEDTFTQATRYNAIIRATHIVITNGMQHFSAITHDFINYSLQKEMPPYPSPQR